MGNFKYVDSVSAAANTQYPYSSAVSSQYTGANSVPQFTVSRPSTSTSAADGSSGTSASSSSKNKSDDAAEVKTDKFIPSTSVVDNIDNAYDAMYCCGTKDKQLEQALDSLNENNIMDFLCGWNKYHSSEKGESFMKAFMWDADSEQKVKYGRKIKNLLVRRAEKSGIYDELKDKFGEIDSELSSTFYVNNDIADTYDEIIAKIAEAEGKENGKPNECYSGFTGAMETCKEHGLIGNLDYAVVGTVGGLVKGIVDLFW